MGQKGVLTLLATAALTLHLRHFTALGMEVASQDATGAQSALIPGRRQLAAARNSKVSSRKNHKGIGGAEAEEWDVTAAEDREDFSGFPEQDLRIKGRTHQSCIKETTLPCSLFHCSMPDGCVLFTTYVLRMSFACTYDRQRL